MNKVGQLAPAATASDLAERINGIYESTMMAMRQAEAAIMEMVWELHHRHFNHHDGEFRKFVEQKIPWLPGQEALKMSKTWNVARANRRLLEHARNKPAEALAFFPVIGTLAGQAELPADEGVAELLSMPPGKRNKRIRDLLRETPGSRSVADDELIKSLATERDELAHSLKGGGPDDAWDALNSYMTDVQTLQRQINKATVETSRLLKIHGNALKNQHPRIFNSRLDLVRGLASAIQEDAGRILDQWLDFDLQTPPALVAEEETP